MNQHDALPYCAQISSARLTALLNQRLSVGSRNSEHLIHISLRELLNHLNIQRGYLKGSAVHAALPASKNMVSAKSHHHDIDLQLPCDEHFDPDAMLAKLQAFIDLQQQKQANQARGINKAKWLNKVSHEFQGAFNRLIVSIGAPGNNRCTIDLNFDTAKPTYDTIGASRSIQFNLNNRSASLTGYWEPKLVDLLQDKQWLWFKPDIDDGLARLSYRLSKAPHARLLQPGIVKHFLDNAEPGAINNIYLRVLCHEYKGCTLSAAEKLALWKPLINKSFSEDNTDKGLQRQLLNWSKCNTQEQLLKVADTTGMQEVLLKNLTTGCMVVPDFKKAIAELLTNHCDIQDTLKPMAHKALGAKLLSGEVLFKHLDTWAEIQDIPEAQLQAVFGEYVQLLLDSDNKAISTQAQHMQGWLNGEELASLQFWLDRAGINTDRRKANSGIHASQMLLDSLLNILKSQGPNGLLSVAETLKHVQFEKNDWNQIIESMFENNIPVSSLANSQQLASMLEFIRVMYQHREIIGSLMPKNSTLSRDNLGSIDSILFHQDMIALHQSLQSEGVPNALRSIMKLKGEELGIELPEMSVLVSTQKQRIDIEVEKTRHRVTADAFSSIINHGKAGETINILWKDSTLFNGQTTPHAAAKTFNGQLRSLCPEQAHNTLQGLFAAGHAVCESIFTGEQIISTGYIAEGEFNSKQLRDAHNLETALLSLKKGIVANNTSTPGLKIQYDIENYKPVLCNIQFVNEQRNAFLELEYESSNQTATNTPTGFENIWGVLPKPGHVKVHHQIQAAPLGIQFMVSSLPWQRPGGFGLNICSIGSTMPKQYRWSGLIGNGLMFPMGSLFLENSHTPAITFDLASISDPIPIKMLPVMAELLGKRLKGDYPFVARMWNNPTGWPSKAWEGFVHELPCGANHTFSGYLTPTGRAIGILSDNSKPGQMTSNAWAGSFQLLDNHEIPKTRFPVDQKTPLPLRVPARQNQHLATHGLVHQYTVNPSTLAPQAQSAFICFCGENLPLSGITQPHEWLYQSPADLYYYSGHGYTSTFNGKEEAVQIDILFKPGDGGSDFAMVRKRDYAQQANRTDVYWNAQGMQAKWLIMNERPATGRIQFPSGLMYEGRVSAKNGFISPSGAGKFTLGAFELAVKFGEQLSLESIEGKNEESKEWLASYTVKNKPPQFNAKVMLELISGEELTWANDVHPHLQIRDLASAVDQVTVFTAPGYQIPTHTPKATNRQRPRTSS